MYYVLDKMLHHKEIINCACAYSNGSLATKDVTFNQAYNKGDNPDTYFVGRLVLLLLASERSKSVRWTGAELWLV